MNSIRLETQSPDSSQSKILVTGENISCVRDTAQNHPFVSCDQNADAVRLTFKYQRPKAPQQHMDIIRHAHCKQHKRGRTAPFTNQLSPEGNLLVDDIEVESAQRVGHIARQRIHLSRLPVHEFDWEVAVCKAE
ncbi:hypothetical protein F2P81_012307 [Scophthalmus maximus]|uniref:Uncharacterized protein n=1 Tax=Scophthalmus maximus TaxID=52904 RepID=A0A6A4SPB3_SCOMX|nr:hypothetical protein F2P81_012307 [Scophthalmus maximus]